jgi:hypothetical protein
MKKEYGHIPDAFDMLPEEDLLMDKEQLERARRAERVLERYNRFYNTECSGLPWGTPITPEFQQAMALECMLDALRCENLNHEFDVVLTSDINALIENLYKQGKEFLEKPYQIVPND